MKKNKIKIIVFLIIVIGVIGFFSVQKIQKEKRKYEVEEISEYKYFVVKENDKYGVIDTSGTKIIDTIYDDVKIPNPQKDVFVCYQDSNTKVLNSSNEEIFTDYNNVEPLRLKNILSDLVYEKTVLKYEKDGKYGIIDINGKRVVKAKYEEIDTLEYKEGELLVKENGKYGVININGCVLVKSEYDKIEVDKYYQDEYGYKNDGYIVCNVTDEGYRYGYVNIDGKEIIDTIYNELYRIQEINDSDVYIICAESGKYGLYKNNKKVIENEYQLLTYSDSNINRIIALKGKKYGVITLEGKIVIPYEYTQINVNGKYIYAISSDENVKVYDKDGNAANIDSNIVVINNEDTDYEIYVQTSDEKTTYSIYKNDKLITEKEYIYIQYLYDNYFIVCESGNKLGIIDDNEKIKIEYNYSSIQNIEKTNILLMIREDTNVSEIYTSDFEKICELKNGKIKSEGDYIKLYNNEDESIYISKEGEILNKTELFPNNMIYAKKSSYNKWGFTDENGRIAVNYIYDMVTEINEYGFAGVEVDGKWGVINSQGKIIISPTYELESKEPIFIGEYYQVTYGNGEIYYTK